ncbi:hypothetical protein EDF36_2011 [Rathayibacter sp. PhB152]|uniref:DUF3322 domain-containing protein n=1 Tax=Rathayibacter sp. PhB152 TaxID=2485190 RepID=UPI000F4C039E|nr:Wadjet anti-phage system protein JetD domain-containing protein [Rathayibacter sp. PhB152]ROQ58567.1 hypothetical protein EDF36_2011 [Rathayibacter sp. PhB152]
MTAPVTVADLRDRAQRIFQRESRSWAARGDQEPMLDLPLHPPTERDALTDLDAARTWVESWRRAAESGEIEVSWTVRSWSRVGSQEIPERAVVRGATSIARAAGAEPEWLRLRHRIDALRSLTGGGDAAVATLQTHARTITALTEDDFDRLVAVLLWLRDNPVSNRFVRELPIRGIDSKWIERRLGLVTALHRSTTGAIDLGLRKPSTLLRVRILDSALALSGLSDVTAPIDDLARLSFHPSRVFVFENLATVLAMPDVPGAVVLHGGGDRAGLVSHLPWAREVTYWGDLDSQGFSILHRLRALGVAATSALMDTETLLAHRDLWGTDPAPDLGALPLLTRSEDDALSLLSTAGNIRLEQERIAWSYALDRLGAL